MHPHYAAMCTGHKFVTHSCAEGLLWAACDSCLVVYFRSQPPHSRQATLNFFEKARLQLESMAGHIPAVTQATKWQTSSVPPMVASIVAVVCPDTHSLLLYILRHCSTRPVAVNTQQGCAMLNMPACTALFDGTRSKGTALHSALCIAHSNMPMVWMQRELA